MDSLKEVVKDKYKSNDYLLEKNFNQLLEEDLMFKKLVNSIELPKKELMKYASSIKDSVNELNNCKKCKNILCCKNTIEGYIYYPSIENENLIFSYVPCKYKKALDKDQKYKENIFTIDMPKEIKNASMKEIHTDDERRFEVIKWIKNYLDNYFKNRQKGLYLTGNFGCGKTYLLSAMLNELAKKDVKVAIVYYPDFLRELKQTFNTEEDFSTKFNYIKRVEVLLIDDIGAETTTQWSRDEILGSLLQYRMQEKLATFFTSNLTIDELEEHLSSSSKGIEKIKARRIIERIKQLCDIKQMISENKRK